MSQKEKTKACLVEALAALKVITECDSLETAKMLAKFSVISCHFITTRGQLPTQAELLKYADSIKNIK